MMTQTEKRRAMANAVERLQREGSEVIGFASKSIGIPVIDIDMPPTWLLPKAVPIRECVNGKVELLCVARLSGCVVRWTNRELPEVICTTQYLNPYAPELIAQWPANL